MFHFPLDEDAPTDTLCSVGLPSGDFTEVSPAPQVTAQRSRSNSNYGSPELDKKNQDYNNCYVAHGLPQPFNLHNTYAQLNTPHVHLQVNRYLAFMTS